MKRGREHTMKYIAYGANMSRRQMARRCPTAQFIGTGRLTSYQLEFFFHATITRVRGKGAYVPVAVWEISAEDEKSLDRIYLDANGYRERKEAAFLKQYLPQIKSAKAKGKPVTLEPMNASDRRIIHRFVEKDKALKTLTLGEGDMKRIVVFSANQSEKEVLSQTPKKFDRKRHPKPKPRQRRKQGDANQNS